MSKPTFISPDTVAHVEELLCVVVEVVVVVVVVEVLVVVVDVVVVDDVVHVFVVQTDIPLESHTHVLQSTVKDEPGVHVVKDLIKGKKLNFNHSVSSKSIDYWVIHNHSKLIMNDPVYTLSALTPGLDRRRDTPPRSPPGAPPHCQWLCCTRH